MAGHNWGQYIRLKLIVTIIRTLNYLGTLRTLGAPSSTCVRKFIRIPSRDDNRTIDAWLYYPENHDAGAPSPLVVNWHGSGMMIPNLGMDYDFCEKIARQSKVCVLDVDYRKSPENPFPAAVEDVEDVLRWVEGQGRQFDLSRVALSGFSAGANLALVAASELKAELKSLNIRVAYIFYPGVDWTIPPESKIIDEPIEPLPIFAQHMFADCYVPNLEDRENPRASPGRADTSKYLGTKIMLLPCSGDIFRPETEAFGKKLLEGGVDVEVEVVKDSAHGFDKTIKPSIFNAEERDRTYALVVKSLVEIM